MQEKILHANFVNRFHTLAMRVRKIGLRPPVLQQTACPLVLNFLTAAVAKPPGKTAYGPGRSSV